MNFRIFVEGKSDQKFLRDFILERFGTELQDQHFDLLGSWSGYMSNGNLIASIQENLDNNKTNILVLDSDEDFKKRETKILQDFQQFGIGVELFLFPTHSENGTLEHLLCNITVKSDILECFEQYEECIKGYESPVIKSKVFAYLDALLPKNQKKGNSNDRIQDVYRDYRNKEHWDLNSSYLEPLRTFLSKHI